MQDLDGISTQGDSLNPADSLTTEWCASIMMDVHCGNGLFGHTDRIEIVEWDLVLGFEE